MFLFFINRLIAIFLVGLIWALAFIVGFRTFYDREKSSPFECGFDPKNTARISFSLRFFLLAVIFLIFDIEIIFFFPIPFIILRSIRILIIFFGVLTLLILIFGLFHEWNEGSLDWSK